MARRTLGFSRVWATRHHREEEGRLFLEEIGPDGLLEVIDSWARERKNLTSSEQQIYTAVTDSTRYKHGVLINVATGSWGDDRRQIIHSRGAKPAQQVDADDATTSATRALFITPPGGDFALFFSEREGNHVGGSRIYPAIEEEIRAQPPVEDSNFIPRKLVPRREVIGLEEEWLKGVKLREVAVQRTRPASTWGGDAAVDDLSLQEKIRPKGKGSLSPRWLADIRKAASIDEAAGVVGFEAGEGETLEALTITVEDGELSKTFEFDNPKTPPLREVLNEHGRPPLGDPEFVDRCGALAAKAFPRYGGTFSYDWLRN